MTNRLIAAWIITFWIALISGAIFLGWLLEGNWRLLS